MLCFITGMESHAAGIYSTSTTNRNGSLFRIVKGSCASAIDGVTIIIVEMIANEETEIISFFSHHYYFSYPRFRKCDMGCISYWFNFCLNFFYLSFCFSHYFNTAPLFNPAKLQNTLLLFTMVQLRSCICIPFTTTTGIGVIVFV